MPRKKLKRSERPAKPRKSYYIKLRSRVDPKLHESDFFKKLPTEFRVQVYRLLFANKANDLSPIGYTFQGLIGLERVPLLPPHTRRKCEPFSCHVNILRTCRAIYFEAVDTLYSNFIISPYPHNMHVLKAFGSSNLRNITRLHLQIDAIGAQEANGWRYHPQPRPEVPLHDPKPWIRILRYFGLRSNRLRHLHIRWTPFFAENNTIVASLGANLDIIRAVAQIKGLRHVRLEGYFPKQWESYLKRQGAIRTVTSDPGYGYYIDFPQSKALEKAALEMFWEDTRDLVP